MFFFTELIIVTCTSLWRMALQSWQSWHGFRDFKQDIWIWDGCR